jgi:hypothetical protein
MTKNQNINLWLIIAVLTALNFTTCSDGVGSLGDAGGSGSRGNVALTINLIGNSRSAIPWPPDPDIINQLNYTITLSGEDETRTITARGGNTIRTNVSPGHWTVRVDAYLNNNRFASGIYSVDVIAGQNTPVRIPMISAFGDFTLYVDMTHGNIIMENINGDPLGNISLAGISLNESTLTLDNFSFTTSNPDILRIHGNNATIVLIGENTLTSTLDNDQSQSIGLSASGTLTIEGSGSLTVTSGIGINSTGISSDINLTISGATITAIGGNASNTSTGIRVGNTLTINNGTVTMSGSTRAIFHNSNGDYTVPNGVRFWTNDGPSPPNPLGNGIPGNNQQTINNTHKWARLTAP